MQSWPRERSRTGHLAPRVAPLARNGDRVSRGAYQAGSLSNRRLKIMRATRFASRLRTTLSEFCAGQGGNIIIPFALALVPIMGAVGAAVDYSRASSDRTAMQA